MQTSTELTDALIEHSHDTPYIVTATDDGFDMTLNIVDAKWYTLLYKNGLKRTFKIHARLDDKNKVARTTDTLYSLDWQGGADAGTLMPRLGGQVSVQKGEVWNYSSSKQYGITEDGKVGKTVDYTFSTSEAKSWLDSELKAAGWKRGLGAEAKGALIVGIGTLILLVVAFGVVLIVNIGK